MTGEQRDRLLGIDAVRALAIAGMVYVHIAPGGWLSGRTPGHQDAVLQWIDQLLSSRAMSLFFLLAGVSVALMTGGARPYERGRMSVARRRLAVRAVMIYLVGLTLDTVLDAQQSVLQFYMLCLLAMLPLVRVRARTLFAAAGAGAVVSAVACFVFMNQGREWPWAGMAGMAGQGRERVGLAVLWHPGGWAEHVRTLLFGGGYQLLYAIPLVLAGLAIGRLDLRSGAVRLRMAVAGAAVAVTAYAVSWVAMGPLGGSERINAVMDPAAMRPGAMPTSPWIALLALPGEQTTYATSVLAAPQMIGVGLLLIAVLVAAMRVPVWRRVLGPLSAMGALSMTWYAAHYVAIYWIWPVKEGTPPEPRSFLEFAVFVVFGLAFSAVWLRWLRRGPLESVVHRVTVLAAPGVRAGRGEDGQTAVTASGACRGSTARS
jgi:uncharacterized protein